MKKTINIANGQGFWGDSVDAPKTLINNKNLDYLTLDYLAEVTMAIMQKQHNKDPKRGYAYDFVEFASDSVDQILENNIKIITNAGGVNPYACAENIKNRTNEKLKVAVVEGDNIIDKIARVASKASFVNHVWLLLTNKSHYRARFPTNHVNNIG